MGSTSERGDARPLGDASGVLIGLGVGFLFGGFSPWLNAQWASVAFGVACLLLGGLHLHLATRKERAP